MSSSFNQFQEQRMPNSGAPIKLPRIGLIRQEFPDRSLKNVAKEVRGQLEKADFAAKMKPGARIAIGVGSRGIARIATIVKAVVEYWKAAGCKPFIFPAMGSHGAATGEGQAAVLAHYGINPETMNCPIISSLEVVSMGRTPEGIETFMDRSAFKSEGVMLVGRVKWHTDFDGKIESGLCKMTAIGLGKLAGARQYHGFGHRIGLERVIRSVFQQIAQSGRIVGGLAIIEDGNHRTAQVTAVHIENLQEQEEQLLALAKSWAGRIPVNALDILILDEIGKEISGTGMDTKVVNRSTMAYYNCYTNAPQVDRIFIRDLSKWSDGNALGMGLADMAADRLIDKVDWQATYVNGLTSSITASTRMPIHFPTDRECLEKLAPTVGRNNPEDLTVAWIANTMNLRLMAVSENLLPELRQNPAIKIVSQPMELPYDEAGNLPRLEELAKRMVSG